MSQEPPEPKGPPGTPPQVPNPFGPFQLLHPLGSGAAGTVYLAEVLEDQVYAEAGEQVAVKILDPLRVEGHGLLDRFQREADLGRQVVHPAVVQTFDLGVVQAGRSAFHFLVMEFVEGRTLRELMRELGALPELLLRDLALQLVGALEAIHAAGAAHRDLKPGNILITPEYQVKVMDLGVAYILESSSRLTREGYFVGTLLYAAPEQVRGEKVGPAADLYSTGVVLYEAATAIQPFEAESRRATVHRQLNHVPPKAGDLSPQLSSWFEEMIARLMEKQPEDRFPSSRSLREALELGEESAWWKSFQQELLRQHPDHQLQRVEVSRETPFVGRFQELKTLRVLFRDAKAGKGRAVLLEGEAGVGKTRLVDEFVCQLHHEGEGMVLLYGRGGSRGRDLPGGSVARSLLQHIGEESLRGKLARYLSAAPHLVPGFAAWLTGAAEVADGGAPLAPEALKAVFAYLLCVLSVDAPLVWVLDDLHADSSEVRGLFSSLAKTVRESSVLLIATGSASPHNEDWNLLRRLDGIQQLSLRRLSPRQIEGMLKDLLNTEVAAATVGRRVGERSAGNPFFVIEMIREMREKQLLGEAVEGGTFSLSGELASVVTPDAVEDLLEGRLEELSEEARELLGWAAVQGPIFDPMLLARCVSEPSLKILASLATVERHSGIVRARGSRFAFDHPQLQEVLYRALSPEERLRMHRQLAEELLRLEEIPEGLEDPAGDSVNDSVEGSVASRLAEHFLRGGLGERALPWVRSALAYLAAEYKTEALLGLAQRAYVAASLDAGLRCDIRRSQVRALAMRGRWRERRSFAEEALALARVTGDPRRLVRAQLTLARVHLQGGDSSRAQRLVDGARKLASGPEEDGEALEVLGLSERRSGHLVAAESFFKQQEAVADGVGHRSLRARARLHLACLHRVAGRYEKAQDGISAILPELAELGLQELVAEGQIELAHAVRALGDYRQVRRELERGLKVARRIGGPEMVLRFLVTLGRLSTEEVRWSEAEHLLQTSLRSAGNRGLIRAQAEATLGLGELARYRGDRDEAERRFNEALELQHRIGAGRDIARTSLALGRLMLEQGAGQLVEPLLREAAHLVDNYRLDVPGSLPRAYLSLLKGASSQGAFPSLQGPVQQRAELLLLRYKAESAEQDLNRCRELLERISGHLGVEEVKRFWRGHPLARAVRKLDEHTSH